jgi:hypothetical protein
MVLLNLTSSQMQMLQINNITGWTIFCFDVITATTISYIDFKTINKASSENERLRDLYSLTSFKCSSFILDDIFNYDDNNYNNTTTQPPIIIKLFFVGAVSPSHKVIREKFMAEKCNSLTHKHKKTQRQLSYYFKIDWVTLFILSYHGEKKQKQ